MYLDALREGFSGLGYIEGKTVEFELRFAAQHYDRFLPLATELVNSNVDVLVSPSTPTCVALHQATKTIPIVCAYVTDPVSLKLVDTLARPGGNLTGFSAIVFDLLPKQVEILRQCVSKFTGLAVLYNPKITASVRMIDELTTAADRLQVKTKLFAARAAEEIDSAFRAISQVRSDGVVVAPDVMFIDERERIAALALAHHLPTIAWLPEMAQAGMLMSYGADARDMLRRSAIYVDRILKGTKPADLPVEQPTKLDLVINLRAAKTLGLVLPPELLARADEVIE